MDACAQLIPSHSCRIAWVKIRVHVFYATITRVTIRPNRRASLRCEAPSGSFPRMTATFTIDKAGEIHLPESLQRIPEVTQGVLENGVLILPKLGIPMDAAAAVRADRDEQGSRATSRRRERETLFCPATENGQSYGRDSGIS